MKLTTSQIAQTALLAALTLVLSYLETLIPLPVTIPGIKLGIANIAVLFALYLIDTKTATFLMLVKVIIASLLFGSPMMIIYSLCGSVLALLGMILLKKTGKVSIVVVSIVAAVLHNMGQLAAATVLLATPAVLVNAPVLIVAACITGAVTGTIAVMVIHALAPNMKRQRQGVILDEVPTSADGGVADQASDAAKTSAREDTIEAGREETADLPPRTSKTSAHEDTKTS